jgi:hypothetical protein
MIGPKSTHSNWLGQQQGPHVASVSKRSNLAAAGPTHTVCESAQTLTLPSGGLHGCSSQMDGGVGSSAVGSEAGASVVGVGVVGVAVVGDSDIGAAVAGAGLAGAAVVGDGVGADDGAGRGDLVGSCVGSGAGSAGGGHLPHVYYDTSNTLCEKLEREMKLQVDVPTYP